MTCEDFMTHARAEIAQIFDEKRDAMLKLIAQARDEGKRNAETEKLASIMSEVLDRLMDEKDRTKIVVEKTEIVRCNNCKYWTACESEENDCDFYGVCCQINRITTYDWYCADGEADK